MKIKLDVTEMLEVKYQPKYLTFFDFRFVEYYKDVTAEGWFEVNRRRIYCGWAEFPYLLTMERDGVKKYFLAKCGEEEEK